jgi:hypothetical protein
MATSLALLLLTSAPDFLAWFCYLLPSPGGHSQSNVSEPNKPDTEQAKIDAHLEQQHRKAETSPSGGPAARYHLAIAFLIRLAPSYFLLSFKSFFFPPFAYNS